MTDDVELLRRYSEEASQEAFSELVARHINFVYAAALRQARNAHRAEDVVQAVFTDLARKAGSLCRRREILGWLYLSTHYAATAVVRGEARREAREQEAHMMQELSAGDTASPDWELLAPVLDAALHELGEADRSAILLRFFKDRSFAEVASALQLTEDAAKKRVQRVLEKLRPILARRGVTSTTAGLAFALAHQSAVAAPAGLAASVTGTALQAAAAGAAGAGLFAGWWQLIGGAKLVALLAIVVAGAVYFSSGWSWFRRLSPAVPPPIATATLPVDAAKEGGMAKAPGSSATGEAAAVPALTLAEILAEPDSLRAFVLYSRHILKLEPGEFPAVFARILEIAKPEQRIDFRNLLLQRWGQVDPLGGLAALTAMQGQPVNGVRMIGFSEIIPYKNLVLNAWSSVHPEDALSWVLANPGDFDWAISLREPGQLATNVLVNRETEGAGDLLRSDYMRYRQRGMINSLTDAGHFRAAADMLAKASFSLNDMLAIDAARSLMAGWGTSDAPAAIAWLTGSLPPGMVRASAVSGLVQSVAAEDLDVATRYVRSLEESSEISAASSGVMANFKARGDSAGAYRWLQENMGENVKGAFDEAIGAYLVMSGAVGSVLPDAGRQQAIITQIRDPFTQKKAVGQYAQTIVDRMPEAAIAAFMQVYPESERWTGGLVDNAPVYPPQPVAMSYASLPSLVNRWSGKDYESAAAFVRNSRALTADERAKLTDMIEIRRRAVGEP